MYDAYGWGESLKSFIQTFNAFCIDLHLILYLHKFLPSILRLILFTIFNHENIACAQQGLSIDIAISLLLELLISGLFVPNITCILLLVLLERESQKISTFSHSAKKYKLTMILCSRSYDGNEDDWPSTYEEWENKIFHFLLWWTPISSGC